MLTHHFAVNWTWTGCLPLWCSVGLFEPLSKNLLLSAAFLHAKKQDGNHVTYYSLRFLMLLSGWITPQPQSPVNKILFWVIWLVNWMTKNSCWSYWKYKIGLMKNFLTLVFRVLQTTLLKVIQLPQLFFFFNKNFIGSHNGQTSWNRR